MRRLVEGWLLEGYLRFSWASEAWRPVRVGTELGWEDSSELLSEGVLSSEALRRRFRPSVMIQIGILVLKGIPHRWIGGTYEFLHDGVWGTLEETTLAIALDAMERRSTRDNAEDVDDEPEVKLFATIFDLEELKDSVGEDAFSHWWEHVTGEWPQHLQTAAHHYFRTNRSVFEIASMMSIPESLAETYIDEACCLIRKPRKKILPEPKKHSDGSVCLEGTSKVPEDWTPCCDTFASHTKACVHDIRYEWWEDEWVTVINTTAGGGGIAINFCPHCGDELNERGVPDCEIADG